LSSWLLLGASSCCLSVAFIHTVAGILAVAGGPAVIGFPVVDGILAAASFSADPGVPFSWWLCRMRRITLSDYGFRNVIIVCYRAIGISNNVLANSRNYRTIGYQIKASIYRNIGYQTQKKLPVAHL
jgi:hypothetical protein